MVEQKVCNCAECGQELTSFWRGNMCVQSQVAARIMGRPMCERCVSTSNHGHPGQRRTARCDRDDSDDENSRLNSWEDIVRAIEEHV